MISHEDFTPSGMSRCALFRGPGQVCDERECWLSRSYATRRVFFCDDILTGRSSGTCTGGKGRSGVRRAADWPCSPIPAKLICTLPPVTVGKTHREGETLPVYGETVPVRVRSGHVTGFSGISEGRKFAVCILRDQGLESCHTLISFSGGKTRAVPGNRDGFWRNPAGSGSRRGNPGIIRARFTVSRGQPKRGGWNHPPGAIRQVSRKSR